MTQQKAKHVQFRGDTEKPKFGCHLHALSITDHEMNNVIKTEVRFRSGILRLCSGESGGTWA